MHRTLLTLIFLLIATFAHSENANRSRFHYGFDFGNCKEELNSYAYYEDYHVKTATHCAGVTTGYEYRIPESFFGAIDFGLMLGNSRAKITTYDLDEPYIEYPFTIIRKLETSMINLEGKIGYSQKISDSAVLSPYVGIRLVMCNIKSCDLYPSLRTEQKNVENVLGFLVTQEINQSCKIGLGVKRFGVIRGTIKYDNLTLTFRKGEPALEINTPFSLDADIEQFGAVQFKIEPYMQRLVKSTNIVSVGARFNASYFF